MNEAYIKDLSGKYYGTIVVLPNGGEIKFWLTFNHDLGGKSYVPSDRELKENGITREEWNNNELIVFDDLYARDLVPACDHFEDQYSYEMAMLFVEAYNNKFNYG